MPVIEVSSGRQLGYIKDFELEDNRITGIYIDTGQDERCYIPHEHISSMGRDAVLVNGCAAVEPEVLEHKVKNRYAGVPVVTSLGQSIGMIEDIIIEENEGSVMGYEVSDGLFKDMVMGRKIITPENILTYGDETVIVADSNQK